jgi:hypothetical protein
MSHFKKNVTLALYLFSIFFYIPLHSQIVIEPTPTHQEIDVQEIKKLLEVDTDTTNQSIVDLIFTRLQEQNENEVLNELTKGLTIDELKKLYQILIEATDLEWTEDFAEKLWQALSLKIKKESPVLYDNPRIELIAVSLGEQTFAMMLSDGTVWEIADHLSGDPIVDLMIIRDLLGQYTEVEQLSVNDSYAYRISALGFPEIRFNGSMLANKSSSLVFENKELYWFGELYY